MKLADLYDEYPDQDEMLWNFIGQSDFENEEFEVSEESITIYATPEFIQRFNTKAQPWQKEVVQDYQNDIDTIKDNPIIVHQDIVVDGNHRLMAMYLAGIRKVKTIEV
jgi:hypothetical protein